MVEDASEREETIVGKGENAGLLFPQCFQRAFSLTSLGPEIMWSSVNLPRCVRKYNSLKPGKDTWAIFWQHIREQRHPPPPPPPPHTHTNFLPTAYMSFTYTCTCLCAINHNKL